MMEALREKFLLRCEEDLPIVRNGPKDPSFKLVIHRLAGVAPMFGFDALGQAALEIDDELCAARAPPPHLVECIGRILHDVVETFRSERR